MLHINLSSSSAVVANLWQLPQQQLEQLRLRAGRVPHVLLTSCECCLLPVYLCVCATTSCKLPVHGCHVEMQISPMQRGESLCLALGQSHKGSCCSYKKITTFFLQNLTNNEILNTKNLSQLCICRFFCSFRHTRRMLNK